MEGHSHLDILARHTLCNRGNSVAAHKTYYYTFYHMCLVLLNAKQGLFILSTVIQAIEREAPPERGAPPEGRGSKPASQPDR